MEELELWCKTPYIGKKAGNTLGSPTADLYRSWLVGWLAGKSVHPIYIPLLYIHP